MLGKKSLTVTSNGLFGGIDSCLIRLVLGKNSFTATSNGLFRGIGVCLIRSVLGKNLPQ